RAAGISARQRDQLAGETVPRAQRDGSGGVALEAGGQIFAQHPLEERGRARDDGLGVKHGDRAPIARVAPRDPVDAARADERLPAARRRVEEAAAPDLAEAERGAEDDLAHVLAEARRVGGIVDDAVDLGVELLAEDVAERARDAAAVGAAARADVDDGGVL